MSPRVAANASSARPRRSGRAAAAAAARKLTLVRRLLWDRIVVGVCYLSAALVVLPLGLILWHLLAKGLSGLSIAFFTRMPTPVGEAGGGMANAIVGTLMVVGTGAIIAVPVGIAAGLYLAEFGRNRFAGLVRYTADLLSGVPSIVVGVAAYGLVVVPMGRFSALALGAPRWKVIQQVVLPAARAGIVTASMLAVARAAGETAPLLFTALGNRFWSVKLDQPIATLPVFIFDYARAPYDDWNRQAWTGALVLVLLVMLISGVLRLTARRIRVR